MKNLMQKFKQEMRENGYKHDQWGTAMSAFFCTAEHLYEIGEVPAEWQFRPGAMGNFIDPENSFYEFMQQLDADELLQVGNYLHKLTNLLELAELSY